MTECVKVVLIRAHRFIDVFIGFENRGEGGGSAGKIYKLPVCFGTDTSDFVLRIFALCNGELLACPGC